MSKKFELSVEEAINYAIRSIKDCEKECPLYRFCGSGTCGFQCTIDCILSRAVAKIDELERKCEDTDEKLKRAIGCCKGRCETCKYQHDCAKHDLSDSVSYQVWYTDCEEWEWMYEEDIE